MAKKDWSFINTRKRGRLYLFVLVVVGICGFLFFGVEAVNADPISGSGYVYTTRPDGSKLYIPGVKVYKKYKPPPMAPGSLYGVGNESTTTSIGYYIFDNYGTTGEHLPGGTLCDNPGWCCVYGPMGNVTNDECVRTSHYIDGAWQPSCAVPCALDCYLNPNYWRPYFPSNFASTQASWLSANGIPFEAGDSDGGGSWDAIQNTWADGQRCYVSTDPGDGYEWLRADVTNDAALRNCNFEWTPPECALDCTCTTDPRSISHIGGGTITLDATITGGSYNDVEWSWRPGTGSCGTLREDASDQTKAYVDFDETDVCTGEIVVLASNSCTASCNCPSFEITNAAPEVVSITPSGGLSGTEPEGDNDLTCTDNNPLEFQVHYRDADGCEDIEEARFWSDDASPSSTRRHESVRGAIRYDDDSNDWRVYGLRCEGGTCNWDVGGRLVSEASVETPYLCFPNDAGGTTDCTSSKTSCDGMGADAKEKCCEGDCSSSVGGVEVTRMPKCVGNDLYVMYKVWYYDDVIGNGLDLYGYVRDRAGAKTAGESTAWADRGDHTLDFLPPGGSIAVGHLEGDAAGRMYFNQILEDSGLWDSGLYRAYEREYSKDGGEDEDGWQSIGDPYTFSGEPGWKQMDFVDGFSGGDEVVARMKGSDMACNAGQITSEKVIEIGSPWIETFDGDVYGEEGIQDPIALGEDPAADPPLSAHWLSSFWLGGMDSEGVWSYGSGLGSGSGWVSDSYGDENRVNARGSRWYGELLRLAENSDFVLREQGGSIDTWGIGDSFSDDKDGVYMAGPDMEVSGSCVGRKVVFVPSGQKVTIVPDFKHGGGDESDEAACLLVGDLGSEIEVSNGDDKGGGTLDENSDVIHIAVVTDGKYTVKLDQEVPKFDWLYQYGFVFSDEASFLRDLVWEDNTKQAAEEIWYDGRYMSLLRDMLGRRVFRDLECGIVKGSGSCDGWLP